MLEKRFPREKAKFYLKKFKLEYQSFQGMEKNHSNYLSNCFELSLRHLRIN